MTIMSTYDHSFFTDLAARLTGQIILPEDETYEQVRQIWNRGVTTRPLAFIRCTTTQDVIHAVRWVRSHGLPLSVRGGGHDFAGRALRKHGVVIDCSLMRRVSINPETRTARIQGGATAGDLIGAAQNYGLATTTGSVSTVGMAGYTLGGGYGSLMGAYGLAVDNLLSAQVVTANGELVNANAEEHADLLWGLRGGGGNFGVVVSLEFRLYPLTTVVSGMVLYPLEQARAVLRRFNDFLVTAPDEVTVRSGFLTMPNGQSALSFSSVYCGPPEAGEQALAPLHTLGKPLMTWVEPIAYNSFIRQRDADVSNDHHYYIQTRSLPELQSETIEALIEQGLPLTSPFSSIGLYHFHGVPGRVSASETAFAHRQNHLMVELIAAWESRSVDEEHRHIQWAQKLSQALAPYALKGGYINILDEQERILLAFGSNYERLLALKRTYDPEDVFSSTTGHIVPTACENDRNASCE